MHPYILLAFIALVVAAPHHKRHRKHHKKTSHINTSPDAKVPTRFPAVKFTLGKGNNNVDDNEYQNFQRTFPDLLDYMQKATGVVLNLLYRSDQSAAPSMPQTIPIKFSNEEAYAYTSLNGNDNGLSSPTGIVFDQKGFDAQTAPDAQEKTMAEKLGPLVHELGHACGCVSRIQDVEVNLSEGVADYVHFMTGTFEDWVIDAANIPTSWNSETYSSMAVFLLYVEAATEHSNFVADLSVFNCKNPTADWRAKFVPILQSALDQYQKDVNAKQKVKDYVHNSKYIIK